MPVKLGGGSLFATFLEEKNEAVDLNPGAPYSIFNKPYGSRELQKFQKGTKSLKFSGVSVQTRKLLCSLHHCPWVEPGH
jgi:hypothetical protein